MYVRSALARRLVAHVDIAEGRWLLNGKVTYAGARAERLTMNVRMVNAVFGDATARSSLIHLAVAGLPCVPPICSASGTCWRMEDAGETSR